MGTRRFAPLSASARIQRGAQWLVLFATIGALACSRDQSADPCRGPHDNPADGPFCESMRALGWTPRLAPKEALCTRLWIDLFDARPLPQDLAPCLDQAPDDFVRAAQTSTDYRIAARRRWVDRLGYSDAFVDPASIVDLDRSVDDLYQGRMTYGEFAIRTLAHPAFVARFIVYGSQESVTEAAFTAFLGRDATRPEVQGIDVLWKPWRARYLAIDGIAETGKNARFSTPEIDPFACDEASPCTSTILGVAVLAFPRRGRTGLLGAADLSNDDWDALRTPGRLVVSLPMFDEAAADDALRRFLGPDAAADPRMEGVREALAASLSGGDLAALDRAVLTSIAYRQSASSDGVERPSFAYGPSKLLSPEAWLRSVGRFTGSDVGDCDWRFPNLPDRDADGSDPEYQGIEDAYPRKPDGTVDAWFRDTAAKMGGCPGIAGPGGASAVRDRTAPTGIDAWAAREDAIVELCFSRPIPALIPSDVEPTDTDAGALQRTAANVLTRAFSHPPSRSEIDEAIEGATGATVEQLARGLCAAIAGGVEYAID
jgi:hypothetical protein